MARGLEANATMSRLHRKERIPKLINAQIEQDQMLCLQTPREKIVYQTPQAKSYVQFHATNPKRSGGRAATINKEGVRREEAAV